MIWRSAGLQSDAIARTYRLEVVMTPQMSLGWPVNTTGDVLLAGAGVVWLFDPVIGFMDSIYGVVAFLLLLGGIAMSLGGLWIVSIPASTT